MANIVVLGVQVPFTSGGQEILVRSLVRELRVRGHQADLIELPYHVNSRVALLEQAELWQRFDFSRYAGLDVDLVIATKFPSYFAKHPRKSLWLVHQHRPIYDLFCTQFSDFSDDPRSEALRRLVMKQDHQAIAECSVKTGISQNVVERLWEYNSIEAEALYPPLPLGGRYYSEADEPYILSIGRICRIKRVDLLVKALPSIAPHIKLKIVGKPDDPEFFDYINNEITKHHLSHRVEFLGRVSEDELLGLLARATAVYYAPYNEDYGFVSLEAMASKRAVLACNDSGGILEFVRHGETGFVVDPTVEAIAQGMNTLVEQPELRTKLGAAGFELMSSSGLLESGWDIVIDKLLRPLSQGSQVGREEICG